MAGLKERISFTTCVDLSASTCAVLIFCFLIWEAIFLHFDKVRLASMMSEKTSGTSAHLCVTTEPTEPAPMMRSLDMVGG